jgi:hypothetical protein
MTTTTEFRPSSTVPPAGPPTRGGARIAALIIGGVLTFTFLGWAILTLVTLTSWQTADGSRTFTASVKRVVVHSAAGGVTITGTAPTAGSSATASWHSRWYFFHPSVHASLTADGTLTVSTSCRQKWVPISCDVRLGLGVPPNVPINVSSSGGGVTASHLTGGLVANSSGGGVHLEHVSGSVRVNSSGGGIHLNDVDGTLVLDSSGGGIHGTSVGSSEASRTINGSLDSVTVTRSPADTTVNAASSGGGINLSFSEPPQRVRARSSGGGVRLALPDVTGDYRIEASSSGGGVHIEIPSNDRSSRLIDVSSSGGGVRVTRPAS